VRRALAILLLAVMGWREASASGLLYVHTDVSSNGASVTPPAKSGVDRNDRIIQGLLQLLGVNYTMATQKAAKAEFCRVGAMTWNFGTSGAYVQSFDAVLHNAYFNGGQGATSYRPDSMMRTAYGAGTGPRVPQLFIMSDYGPQVGGDNTTDATCCTTGVSVGPRTFAGAKNGAALDPRTGLRWETSGSFLGGHIANSTKPAGGFRPLLQLGGWNRPFTLPYTCAWCDSTFLAGIDTVLMWERPFSHLSGAKSVVFCYPDGQGSVQDSIFDASLPYRDSEYDVGVALCGLARLDSLSGNVLFNKNELPLVRGLTIEGLCSRNRRVGAPRGINPADTSFFYATIDSLATLTPPIRVVFGVNADPDSMSAYKRDLQRVASTLPYAKFTPTVYTAVTDSTAAMNGGATKNHRPRDVWGRYRARAAYGDGTCAGADTSLFCQLMGAKFELDSVLTSLGFPGRMSTFAIAPDDDWSPKTVTPLGGGPPMDSVYWAISKAGYTGIRVNAMDQRANAYARSISTTNPWGWDNRQGRISNTIDHKTVTLLAHSGYPIIGSKAWFSITTDSVGPSFDSTCAIGVPAHEMSRVWAGFTQDRDGVTGDGDSWSNDFSHLFNAGSISNWNSYNDLEWPRVDHGEAPKKGYVVRLCANDLSGFSTGPLGPGARNGWWIIKQANTVMNTVNLFDGRTVIRWGYPEEIRP